MRFVNVMTSRAVWEFYIHMQKLRFFLTSILSVTIVLQVREFTLGRRKLCVVRKDSQFKWVKCFETILLWIAGTCCMRSFFCGILLVHIWTLPVKETVKQLISLCWWRRVCMCVYTIFTVIWVAIYAAEERGWRERQRSNKWNEESPVKEQEGELLKFTI